MSRSFQKSPVAYCWKNRQSKLYKRATSKRRRVVAFGVLKSHLLRNAYGLKERRWWKPCEVIRK